MNEIVSDAGDGVIDGNIDDVRADASSLMQKQGEISKQRFDSHRRIPKKYKEGDLVRELLYRATGNLKS